MTTVAVTGASGFVGAHIVREALAQGYNVRSIVRNQEKCEKLRKIFPDEKHTVAYVSDIRDEKDLEKAFEGVAFVQHVASPYNMTFSDPRKDMLDPAIEGTQAVMRAAMATPTVKHVLITSSFAAMNCYEKGGTIRDYTYTADDWNPATYEGAASQESKVYVYMASKVLAEKRYAVLDSRLRTWMLTLQCLEVL